MSVVDGSRCLGNLTWGTLQSGAPPDHFVCTGDLEFDGTCQDPRGPWGAALIGYDSQTSSYYMAGAASQIPQVCVRDSGYAFSKVALYFDWIMANM